MDGAFLSFKSRSAEPRTASGDSVGIQVQQCRGKRRCGRGVADAHLSHRQQLRPLPDQFFRQGSPPCHGREAIFSCHGRSPADVPRRVSHPQVPHAGMLGKVQDSHIHRDHAAVCLPRHGVGRAASLCEGNGNFSRHLAAALADALSHHTVVGAENQQRLFLERKVRLPSQGGNPRDHVLKQAKTAQRLCHFVPACFRLYSCALIRRADLPDHFIDCFPALHTPNMPLQIVLPEAALRRSAGAESLHTACRSPVRSASFFRLPFPP